MTTGLEPIPYRIRIGVTGHRELNDPARVQTLVKHAIDNEIPRLFTAKSRAIIDRVRVTGATTISYSVLSPIAEGTDRVVARAVLSYPGARLDPVLPMAVEDYLEDFATEESKREFAELLSLNCRPTRLRTKRVWEERLDAEGQAALRHDAYKAAGEYIVDHSDVLIAVWDGEPARGKGGTAQIVEYALIQGRPVIRIWHDGYVVLNSAESNGLDASALEGVDKFNRLPTEDVERTKYTHNLDYDFFETPKAAAAIPVETRAMVNQCLLPYYAQASLVSKASRDAFHRAGRDIYVLSAVAVGCAAIGVLFEPLSALGFGTELVVLVVVLFRLSQARRRHAHQAWIEFRFLTERIRSGIFMAICGVEPRPMEVLPYMGHSQTVNDWMVRVFDEIWARVPALKRRKANELTPLTQYAGEAWIGNQIEFHRKKAVREGRRRHRLARASAIVLPVTVAAAAAHLTLLGWKPTASDGNSALAVHRALDQGLAFVALLFPAVAAALAGMEAHREHLRLEKRSENMAPQLVKLERQLQAADEPERFETLLQQADEIMLREAQDWLMLMRYVEIKAG